MAAQKTWTQVEAELDETFRKWWPTARDQAISTTWKQDAAGRRRALRATSDLAERQVTLTFEWRHPATREPRTLRIMAEKRDRAIDNLAALARACEWLRMAEVRELTGIITILMRQMSATPAGAHAGNEQGSSSHGNQQGKQQTPPLSSGPYAVLHITNDAPLPVAEAAYRAAAREFHAQANHGNPGGSEALRKMQALNAAIAAIRAERAAEYANRK